MTAQQIHLAAVKRRIPLYNRKIAELTNVVTQMKAKGMQVVELNKGVEGLGNATYPQYGYVASKFSIQQIEAMLERFQRELTAIRRGE